MEDVLNVATYFAERYKNEFGEPIDEMKLHKLMYLAQRESYIRTDEPLFDATFYGWKYGPVLKEVRTAYRDGELFDAAPRPFSAVSTPAIVDYVFDTYAHKSSWSLSVLTHGEQSWKNARTGLSFEERGDCPLKDADIHQGAVEVRERREMLDRLGLAW